MVQEFYLSKVVPKKERGDGKVANIFFFPKSSELGLQTPTLLSLQYI